MFVGAVLALCLVDAKNVVRKDGSKVILMKNPTWKSEFIGLYQTLKQAPYVVLLFPMFFSSNWFYTYQFNGMNGAHFNTRTGALNNTLYWIMQIVGAFCFGYALDLPVRRTLRAKACLITLFCTTLGVWGGGWAWQSQQDLRAIVDAGGDAYEHVDWLDSGYIGPMFLYMFYGFYDASWQTAVYWYAYLSSLPLLVLEHLTNYCRFMGALSNSGRKTANFAGFYKGIQSAGAAICWSIDARKTEYNNQFFSCWGLLLFSLVCASPVIWCKIKDTVPIEEDLKGTDETVQDVMPDTSFNHHGMTADDTELNTTQLDHTELENSKISNV